MITGQKKVKSLYKYNGKERTEESEYHKLWKKTSHENVMIMMTQSCITVNRQ